MLLVLNKAPNNTNILKEILLGTSWNNWQFMSRSAMSELHLLQNFGSITSISAVLTLFSIIKAYMEWSFYVFVALQLRNPTGSHLWNPFLPWNDTIISSFSYSFCMMVLKKKKCEWLKFLPIPNNQSHQQCFQKLPTSLLLNKNKIFPLSSFLSPLIYRDFQYTCCLFHSSTLLSFDVLIAFSDLLFSHYTATTTVR